MGQKPLAGDLVVRLVHPGHPVHVAELLGAVKAAEDEHAAALALALAAPPGAIVAGAAAANPIDP